MVSYDKDTQTCNFFCLSDKEFYKLHLPELHNRWCCGSSHGWLITIDDELQISLLNPFSRAQIHLPSHPLFPHIITTQGVIREESGLWKYNFIHKAILSDDPILNPNCIVMAIVSDLNRFSYCKLGGETWTVLKTPQPQFMDAASYGGKIYATNYFAVTFDPDNGPEAKMAPFFPWGSRSNAEKMTYLVNCSGDLFYIIRYWKIISPNGEGGEQQQQLYCDEIDDAGDVDESDNGNSSNSDEIDDAGDDGKDGWIDGDEDDVDERPDYKTLGFQVYKLDPEDYEWIELKSLEGRALFLGGSQSLFLSVSNCKADCIYFMDDNFESCLTTRPRCSDTGIFNMMDGSIQSFPLPPDSWSTPPFWFTQNPW